jgi:hypothetical protein
MDNLGLLFFATVIEGTCAIKIARKFNDVSPTWKFFIPIYNVLVYGKFSLVSPHYLFILAFIQAIDLIFSFGMDMPPSLSSLQLVISITSFLMWAIMVSRIATRLGQGFWQYLSVTVISAVAGNYAVVALLYMAVPAFNGTTDIIPFWATGVAVLITSLPFISLAFDKHVRQHAP